MMTSPIIVSAPCCTGSGRKALNSTIGTPKAKSVVAWPDPQARPSFPALLPPRFRSEESRVVTAARWSGSVACRRPRRTATPSTTTSALPSEREEIQLSSPNIAFLSGYGGQRADRHRDAEAEDDARAHGRQQPDERALEARAGEEALRSHRHETDAADGGGEAEREGHDQHEPVADTM